MNKFYCKPPKKKQPIWRFVRKIFKLIYPVKEINFEGEKFTEKCIIVSNHCNKKGPMVYEVNLPIFHARWGAYQMLGNYKSRFKYLRDVLYIQKNKVGKKKASFKAFFEAFFSLSIYKGMKVIPSFPDARLRKTLDCSIKTLESGCAVGIYPEDSSNGYFDEMTSFLPGFVLLSNVYYKKHGEDLPVYSMYYDDKQKKIYVGKPFYVQKLIESGMNKEQVAEFFKNEVNRLYYTYVKQKNIL